LAGSSLGRLADSKRRTVGLDCTRAGTPFARGFRGAKAPDGLQTAHGWSWGDRGSTKAPRLSIKRTSVCHEGFGRARRLSRMAGVGGQYPDEWVSRGAIAPLAMGAGRAKSPARGQSAKRLLAQEGSMPDLRHRPGVSNRGAQRAPLARWRCTTTHILRPSTLVKPGSYYDQRFVLHPKRQHRRPEPLPSFP